MTYAIPANAKVLEETRRLLADVVRYRARRDRARKDDALSARYQRLNYEFQAALDPWALEAAEERKVRKLPGWRATKEEREQIKAGTFRLNPPVTITQPDSRQLLGDAMNLIDAYLDFLDYWIGNDASLTERRDTLKRKLAIRAANNLE